MLALRSINRVLQGIKEIVNVENEWVGNSLKATLVDVCSGMSGDMIMRYVRVLEDMNVVSRSKVRLKPGMMIGRGTGIKLVLLRPKAIIVKGKIFFEIVES